MKPKDLIVIIALCMTILLGFVIGGAMTYHLLTAKPSERHEFEWIPFVLSACMILFPALAIQRGSIGDALKTVKDNAPGINFGRRSYDKVPVAEIINAENRVTGESSVNLVADSKPADKRSESASSKVSGSDYEDSGIL